MVEKKDEKKSSFASSSASSFAKASEDKKASVDKKASEDKKQLNLEELKKQLEDCQKLKDEYLAGWQRAQADFLNYKKEEAQKFGEFLKYAMESLVLNFLPILDNLEIAKKNLSKDLKENPEVKGILQIEKQIQDFLKLQGFEEIETKDKKFDVNFQEVVEKVEKKDCEPGTILEIVQKGYKFNGKIVRPVKVRVAK